VNKRIRFADVYSAGNTEDHQIVRAGLCSLLERESHIAVVGEASDGRTACAMVAELLPDVVVMDIGMQGLNGIEATRKIKSEFSETRVIALSMHSDRRFVSGMLGAGANGYLLKDSAFEELVDAISAVMSDRVYLSHGVASVVVEDYAQRVNSAANAQSQPPALARLSPREREVLQLVAEGQSTKQIAATLGLSVKTIETHRHQVMDKLGIYTLAGLIRLAFREGLVPLE
jgi:DNA-binding NarL/FixJ family response regulator